MRRWMMSCLVAGIAGTPAWAETPVPQPDRRDRMAPELVVESGGRRGTCDVLTFTGDGKNLLAAGDDKVVRLWQYRDGLLDPASKVLRWSVWREKRGAIYALAVSPDPQGKRVAIGGLGMKNTAAAVIDRLSGEILHTVYATDAKLRFGSVRAIDFSPRGERIALGSADGSVWLWRPDAKEDRWLTRLGRHAPIADKEFNFIRLVRFLDENRLLSVAESGEVLRWDLTADPPRPRPLTILEGVDGRISQVAVSADGKWLAATASAKPFIAVRSLNGGERKDIELDDLSVAVSLAFDTDARRLAVGIRSPLRGREGFYLLGDDRISLYDLTADKPVARPGPPHSWHVDSLVFHPDGKHLAVAGGENHEVKLWKLNHLHEPVSVRRGVGSGLWGVALSKNDNAVAFQTQRHKDPKHPNERGQGAWTVFDLEGRELHKAAANFVPRPQRQTQDGWRIRPGKDTYVWYVERAGTNIKHRLPLDEKRNGMPNCYAFLPPASGQPVRVAVGHYNGVSVFAVTERGVRRLWFGEGHDGKVLSLAISSKGDWLVTASDDQTISAWSLRDWPSESELGARLRSAKERVFVEQVDLHSPAWEAGLKAGDEVGALGIDRRLLFRRPPLGDSEAFHGSVDTCLDALRTPEPGQILDFSLRRPGQQKSIATFTTVRRRPLWRLFPTRDNEWVLWMWGHYYYDTSTNGDSYIGWQMNDAVDVRRTPAFYRVKQFHDRFHRLDAIDTLLATRNVRDTLDAMGAGLEPPNFGLFDSVLVRIEAAKQVADEEVVVTLHIEPRIQHVDYLPVRAELWVNDHRLKIWPLEGKPFDTKFTIKRDKLRKGNNNLTLQCYNRVEGRGEGWLEASASVRCERAVVHSKLHGLVVGLNDYSPSARGKNGKPMLHNLRTPLRDAKAMRDAWLEQKKLLYEDVRIDLLPEGKEAVGRQTILKHLERLADRVGPDDHVFVFLAGHGELVAQGSKKRFVFCCPDFDPKNAAETSVSARELYAALAKIPGRKIVFLDACRAGHVAGQPARDLTPGGRGPIILAACDRGESSYEILGEPHALFAKAILEAMGERFVRADRNRDSRLNALELYDYTARRVPELLKDYGVGRSQTPARSPAELARYPVLARKVAEK